MRVQSSVVEQSEDAAAGGLRRPRRTGVTLGLVVVVVRMFRPLFPHRV